MPKPNVNITYNPPPFDPAIHPLVDAFMAKDKEGLSTIIDEEKRTIRIIDYPHVFFADLLLSTAEAIASLADFLDVPMSEVDSSDLGEMTVREGWLMAEHEIMLQRFKDLNSRMIKMEQTFAAAKKRVESQNQPPPLIQPAGAIIDLNRHERRANAARARSRKLN
jgi:hypothetical protein